MYTFPALKKSTQLCKPRTTLCYQLPAHHFCQVQGGRILWGLQRRLDSGKDEKLAREEGSLKEPAEQNRKKRGCSWQNERGCG